MTVYAEEGNAGVKKVKSCYIQYSGWKITFLVISQIYQDRLHLYSGKNHHDWMLREFDYRVNPKEVVSSAPHVLTF